MATIYECQGWNTTGTLSHLGGTITESAAITAGGGRLVGNRLSAPNNNDYWRKQSIWAGVSTAVVGFAFFYSVRPSSNSVIYAFLGAGTTQLFIDPSGFLGVVAASAGTFSGLKLLATGIWYYIELKMVYSATVGAYEVRVNGETVGSGSSLNTGAGTVTGYDIGACYGGGLTTLGGAGWDDFYVADTFLGDVRVDTVYPTAEGNTIQWTPSTGTDNSATIDETPPSDTDYNGTANVGDKDTYLHGDLPVAGDVHAIKIKWRAWKTDAGAGSVQPVIRSGGVDYDGTAQAVSTGALGYDQIYNTNPDTAAAWTDETEVNACEFGVKRAA